MCVCVLSKPIFYSFCYQQSSQALEALLTESLSHQVSHKHLHFWDHWPFSLSVRPCQVIQTASEIAGEWAKEKCFKWSAEKLRGTFITFKGWGVEEGIKWLDCVNFKGSHDTWNERCLSSLHAYYHIIIAVKFGGNWICRVVFKSCFGWWTCVGSTFILCISIV